MNPSQAFDLLAAGYDKLWICSPAGRLQREAFRNATRVLSRKAMESDIDCGAGEQDAGPDAIRHAGRGHRYFTANGRRGAGARHRRARVRLDEVEA